MSSTDSPKDAEVQRRLYDVARSTFRESIQRVSRQYVASRSGRLGGWIGDDPSSHAGNIAFMTILGLLILLFGSIACMFFVQQVPTAFDGMKSIILALIALMGTILGYIFGRSGGSKG